MQMICGAWQGDTLDRFSGCQSCFCFVQISI
jgi:hypothetical protein